MITVDEFTDELRALAVSFDHNLKTEKIVQWFEDFQFLTRWQVHQICESAKRELERFPSVKYLHDQVRSRDWRGKKEKPKDIWITVECPKCDASFVVTPAQARQSMEQGAKYPCPNRDHWHCMMVFDPATILRKAPNAGDIIWKKDWAQS